MDYNETQKNSRREFIKKGSLVTISTITLANPLGRLVSDFFEGTVYDEAAEILTCELFRFKDLLHLKFYFFNVDVKKSASSSRLVANGSAPIYLYIELPPQHITEEYLTVEQIPQSRKDFKRQRSFLSNKSWLAFKVNKEGDKNVTVMLDETDLLNWNDKFSLMTMDDVIFDKDNILAEKWRKTVSNWEGGCVEIKGLLKNIIDAYQKKHIEGLVDQTKLYNNGEDLFKNVKGELIPLSTFEVPYKMMLSPINDTKDGRYNFDSNEFLSLYNKKGVHICEVWHNNLKYNLVTGEKTNPRFKIVNYLNASVKDNDKNNGFIVDLLPSPMNRMDLHNLTLYPEKERDVTSKQFEISALGASASLQYSHPDPLNHTLVAWNQEIKYTRDNFASVTHRALDLFTGLKLLVTVLIERTYVDKVTFMKKRYFISFAQKEKEFGFMFPNSDLDNNQTVSRTPFEKIKVVSEGMYFKPMSIPKRKDGIKKEEEIFEGFNADVYAVMKEGSTNPLDPEKYLVFNYIGIDKEGKEHPFLSKMSIVFPESHIIEKGSFKFTDENGTPQILGHGKTVDFKYIGQLDPALLIKEPGAYCDLGVEIKTEDNKKDYEYKRLGVFENATGRNRINESIIQAYDVFTFKTRINDFEQSINGTVSYAKIEELRKKNSTGNSIITASSTAATFETVNFLLFSNLNPHHNGNERPYLKAHPVVPELVRANVIIPQIDQIEGQSMLRQVKFAKDYVEGKENLDISVGANGKYLFFELIKKQTDFFKENYRKAGGMVNPGISITHVSALDNGITYNELHNRVSNPALKKAELISSSTAITSVSIFGEADAQIVGIPMRAIIDVVLSEVDIPEFKFKQDLQDMLEQFQKLRTKFANIPIVHQMQEGYENAKKLYEDTKGEYDKAIALVEQLRETNVFEFVSTLTQQSGLLLTYEFQKEVTVLKNNSEDLITECTKKLKTSGDNLTKLFTEFKAGILNKTFNEAEKKVVEIMTNFEKFSDGTEAYSEEIAVSMIIELLRKNLKDELEKTNSTFFKVWNELSHQFKENEIAYANLKKWNTLIKKVESFSLDYKMELVTYSEQIADSLKKALLAMPEDILGVLVKLFPSIENNPKVFSAFIQVLIQIEMAKNTFQTFEQEIRKLDYQDLEKLMLDYQKKLVTQKDKDDLKKAFDNYASVYKENVKTTQKTVYNRLFEIKKSLQGIKNSYGSTVKQIINDLESYVGMFESVYKTTILLPEYPSNELKNVQAKYNIFEDNIEKFKRNLTVEYENAIDNAKDLLKNLTEYEKHYKSFVKDALQQLKTVIADEEKRLGEMLKEEVQNITHYNEVKMQLNQLKAIYTKLMEPVNLELKYHYSYNKFRRASFAGVIDFIPDRDRTQLTIDVSYATRFQLTSLDPGGLKISNSYHTMSSLTNFKIGLAQIIFVDFSSVSFTSGSDVKDDFTVKIKSVDFGGIMAFVDAFKEYLKSLDNNLVFDLNTSRAQIGYGISLPNVTAGAFNFFNLSLSALLILPFDPKKSLQLQFGFGNDLNKFGITVSAIFGGQGYFVLIAEPKRGIIGLIIVLEFGAIFNLNLTVASGTAYLVGGIYIRRQKNESGRDLVECRAYILAVGRLRIVGLFSASLTFYVGLHGDGHILRGVATVTASKRFSRFFEISVGVSYEKIIKGAKRDEIEDPEQSLFLHTLDVFSAEPGDKGLAPISIKQQLNLTADELRSRLKIEKNDSGTYSIKEVITESNFLNTIGFFKSDESRGKNYLPGNMELELKDVKREFFIVIINGGKTYLCPATFVSHPEITNRTPMDSVSVEEYYASYF